MDFEEHERHLKEGMSFDKYLNSLGYAIEYEVSKWHYEDVVNELGEIMGRGQIPDDHSVILTKDGVSVIFKTTKEFDELQTATKDVIETKFFKKLMEAQNNKKPPT